ncbi:MAG: hypothetical protein ACKOX5_06120, partial [Bacteroidota bacterium]
MKKFFFLIAIIAGTLTSVNSFGQGKGQIWLGGNANANIMLSPDFALTLGAGPLRRIPPRGFEVLLTKSDSAWSDGMAAWETLVTGSQDLV